LPIDQACEELLRVPEHQGPGENLRGRVQCAEAWNELATHEQQTEEGGDGAGWQLENGQPGRQPIPFRRAADGTDRCGTCHGSGGEPDEFNDKEVLACGGLNDCVIDVFCWCV